MVLMTGSHLFVLGPARSVISPGQGLCSCGPQTSLTAQGHFTEVWGAPDGLHLRFLLTGGKQQGHLDPEP